MIDVMSMTDTPSTLFACWKLGPKTLTRALQAAGFERVEARQDINPGHLALSIQNWLQRKQDLAHNSALEFGRAKYLAPLILALIPFGILQAIAGTSGNMTFTARAPERG